MDNMKIMKRYVDEDNWIETTQEECLEHTEKSGYWKPGTVLLMLTEGHIVHTPFAIYKKQQNMYTYSQLNQMRVSKRELFSHLEQEEHEFDYALPQDWLNSLSDFCMIYRPDVTYYLILSTTVWLSPESAPYTVCAEVNDAITLYKTHST